MFSKIWKLELSVKINIRLQNLIIIRCPVSWYDVRHPLA